LVDGGHLGAKPFHFGFGFGDATLASQREPANGA
jgi:hypothetical protein